MIILNLVKDEPQKAVFNKEAVLVEKGFIDGVMFKYSEIKTKENVQAAYEYAAKKADEYYQKGSLERSTQYMLDRLNLISFWEDSGYIPLIPGG